MVSECRIREIVPDVPEGLETGLENYWYPIAQSDELGRDEPLGVTVLGRELALWRDRDGDVCAVHGRCPHRNAELGIGRVLDGQLQCLFHGLRFDGSGRCALIPWEPEDSRLRGEISVTAYPAEERGGYIWIYVGDADAFPPPPLEDELPEELLDEENFVWFRFPTEIWEANWLLTLDGQDAYHPVTLHAGSQSVAAAEGRDVVPLAERRVKIVDTSYGIRAVATDRDGNPIGQGHFTDVKGDRFILPCLSTNPLRPRTNLDPYVVRVWQMAIDAERTLVSRFASFRANGRAHRERLEGFFHEVVKPRASRVSAEDAVIAAAQGSLVDARANEFLFNVDQETVRLRRQIKSAFLAQREGRRTPIPREALVFPL